MRHIMKNITRSQIEAAQREFNSITGKTQNQEEFDAAVTERLTRASEVKPKAAAQRKRSTNARFFAGLQKALSEI